MLVPPNPRLMMYGSLWESPIGVSTYWSNIGEGILSGSYRSNAHKWAGWWWISKDFLYLHVSHYYHQTASSRECMTCGDMVMDGDVSFERNWENLCSNLFRIESCHSDAQRHSYSTLPIIATGNVTILHNFYVYRMFLVDLWHA